MNALHIEKQTLATVQAVGYTKALDALKSAFELASDADQYRAIKAACIAIGESDPASPRLALECAILHNACCAAIDEWSK